MGDMGCCLPACPARYQEEVATCYYSLCPSGVYWYYTLWERESVR